MGIIKTGLKATKTIRNISRSREILAVFAKHGFDEFITIGVRGLVPNFLSGKSKESIKDEFKIHEKKHWPEIVGKRLRKCFEELGTSFIKLGQLLSSREDLFDPKFIAQMQLLRDQADPLDFSIVKGVIEESLGGNINDFFESIDENPIGTASIGVVHKAKLKDGSDVVIKVKRPGIDKIIETDFSIIMQFHCS